jgi:hypothetical protein
MQGRFPQLQKYRAALHSMFFLTNLSACQRSLYSVSSVQTLEEAKVTRGCLYMAMPVQEVGDLTHQSYTPPTS